MRERRTLAWFSVLGFFAADYARYGFMAAQYAPARIVQLLDPARDATRLAQLGYPAMDAPRAYVCTGQKCLAPVSAPDGIVASMKKIAK